jgi:(p)ppGpp synthase/HD superfamily hydrolase
MIQYETMRLLDAVSFAAFAHRNDVRKYTNEPYIVHPIEVATLVIQYTSSIDGAIVALLHDVVEDTQFTISDIIDRFGTKIARHVAAVTKPSKKEDGNRATRREMDRLHYAKGDTTAHNVKLADVMSNSRDIVNHDPEFAKIYLKENLTLAKSLDKGHPNLRKDVIEMLELRIQSLDALN